MTKRDGFVSNSSSSSFVVRTSSLTPEQVDKVKAFASKHHRWFDTDITIGVEFIEGYLEAHNGVEDGGETAEQSFSNLMDAFGVTSEDYAREYCGCIDEVKEKIGILPEFLK